MVLVKHSDKSQPNFLFKHCNLSDQPAFMLEISAFQQKSLVSIGFYGLLDGTGQSKIGNGRTNQNRKRQDIPKSEKAGHTKIGNGRTNLNRKRQDKLKYKATG